MNENQAVVSVEKKLTAYPQGSLRELWHIAFPLVISLMSVSLMLFLDRLFLAHYSIEAMNASAHAGALTQFLQFWTIATASIAEVFVGRYNGAQRYQKLGQPVWQMIWLAVGTAFLYIPIALFAGPYLFFNDTYRDLEIEYFKILTSFIPVAAISAALSSFYIGRGKVRFVTYVMFAANIMNVILDGILIFGIDPIIPPQGIGGAAWATGISQSFQAGLYLYLFLSRRNREKYGTGRWQLNKRLFRTCLFIGLPNAVAHSIEIFSWVLIFDLMSRLGSDYLTVVTVAQSILFLFTFMTEGMSKGATAIASNFIGSNQHHLVWKLFGSGVKFYGVAFLFLGLILVFHPDPMIHWFIPNLDIVSPSTYETLKEACFWVWIYFFFDGVSWLLIGLLTAAGDTRFIMKVGGSFPIVLALLPVYLFVYHLEAPANITWMCIAMYAIAAAATFFWRFRGEQWKSLALS